MGPTGRGNCREYPHFYEWKHTYGLVGKRQTQNTPRRTTPVHKNAFWDQNTEANSLKNARVFPRENAFGEVIENEKKRLRTVCCVTFADLQGYPKIKKNANAPCFATFFHMQKVTRGRSLGRFLHENTYFFLRFYIYA